MGKLVYFDQANFDHVCYNWDHQLLPALEKLAATYNDLSIHTLNQETFIKIIRSGIAFVELEYKEALISEKKNFKKNSKVLGHSININIDSEELIAFRKAYQDLTVKIENVNRSVFNPLSAIDITDCKIVKGKPVINKDEIRQRFTSQIDSESKEEFYNQLLITIQAWNKLRVIINSQSDNNSFRYRIFADKDIDHGLDDGFLMEDENGMLKIVEKNFNDLFS